MASWGTPTDEKNNRGWTSSHNENNGLDDNDEDDNNKRDSAFSHKRYCKHHDLEKTFNQEVTKRSRDSGKFK